MPASTPPESFAFQIGRLLAHDGVQHMQYLLNERPHEATGLKGHLDEVENALIGYLASPICISALALVTAGSRQKAVDALPRVTALYRRFANEHRERRNAAGIGNDSSPLQAFVTDLEA
jgi:hypothetical protein